MSELVDAGAPHWRWLFKKTANPASYSQQGAAGVSMLAFIRGVRSDDLFASAMQQDVAGVIDAAQFAAAFPAHPMPARFDRLRTPSGTSYSVEEWRGSPNDDAPVFFKLLLRGGQQ